MTMMERDPIKRSESLRQSTSKLDKKKEKHMDYQNFKHYDTNMRHTLSYQKKILAQKHYEQEQRANALKGYGYQT